MKWGKKQGYISENHFLEMTIKTKQNPAEERLPFDTTDIGKIFNTENPLTKTYHKWVPLLGYYTGARLNEICQLHVSDIRMEDGTWYIDINDNTDNKRLKNRASKRKVPIHKSLIRLKFLDYVEKQKINGLDRLFPELKKTCDGYGGNASKWFGRHLIKQAVIHNKKSFHSFRHTFTELLKKAKVDTKEIAGLVGHYDADITTNRYGSGELPITILDEAIQKLPPHRDDI
jgi:integrase